ncbi:ABC transporter ATP-binding protein [Neomegalonema sp.]|uniref:ABC transporter ATP-binding protein n=1 Tax=Neomegalonema sp. TaxID=2039713 RepID=UPI002611A709|nr:ATP-binding cassette domain-containing protein [Neomegalonema sp.]MDD2868107.1 ATP-binding cassette domain-containing protein [Neomegalonema sp.]
MTIRLSLSGIHKRYGDFEVLKGVSLQAHSGDVIVLIGSSGSGKSTLLRCCNLLEIPEEGEIRITGETVKLVKSLHGRKPGDAKQLQRLRSKLGFVFQSFNLWAHMTVLENVIEAPIHVKGLPRREAVEKARDLLAKVGVVGKEENYPSQLSGGQQQRVAIARALAMDPEAMLFDEPTSALDPELVGEVLKVIRDLAAEGRTMLMVTHEMNFAREVASEIVFLHQGVIEEQGSPEAVFGATRSERLKQFLARAAQK